MHDNHVAIAILAAGMATRFGGNKLLEKLDGVPVGLHIGREICRLLPTPPAPASPTPAHLPLGPLFAICRDDMPDLSDAYREIGFNIIINRQADAGLSLSMKLAVQAASDSGASALLICLADMPFISAGHLMNIIGEYRKSGDPVTSSHNGIAMPPALFPDTLWPRMLDTMGDVGGRGMLDHAHHIETPPEMLVDIDTAQDLAAAKNRR